MINLLAIKSNIKNYLLSKRAYKFFIANWQGIADLEAAKNLLATMRQSQTLKPLVTTQVPEKSALVIAPHPDDELIGMGGCLWKMLDCGTTVNVLYLTRGSKSDSDYITSEINKVAEDWHYQTQFLNAYSKHILPNKNYLSQIREAILTIKPQVIFLPFVLDDHDDHRMASHLLYKLFVNNDIQWKGDIWAYQVYSVLPANVYVDITTAAQYKRQAIASLKSQMNKRDWVNFSLGMNAFNTRFSVDKEQKYLEAFFVLPIYDYLNYCESYYSNSHKCYQNSEYNKLLG